MNIIKVLAWISVVFALLISVILGVVVGNLISSPEVYDSLEYEIEHELKSTEWRCFNAIEKIQV